MRSCLTRPNLPPEQSFECQVEIGGKIRLAYASGGRVSAHHEQATSGQAGETSAYQLPEPSLYPVAHHRRTNRTADYKAYLRWRTCRHCASNHGASSRGTRNQQACGKGRAAGPAARAQRALELLRTPHSRLLRQHGPSKRSKGTGHWSPTTANPLELAKSNGQLGAALTTAGGEDSTACAGAHALAEAVDLRAPTVVRLERTLAHWNSRGLRKMSGGLVGRRAARHCLPSARRPPQTRHRSACLRYGGSLHRSNRGRNPTISTTYPPPAT